MKRLNKITRSGLVLLAAFLILAGTAAAAYAADAASLDFSRSGSVELTLADSDGNPVSGGTISIYEVASLYLDDGNMAYAYTEEFSGCTEALDAADASLAKTLADYAEENCVCVTSAPVSGDGTVSFGGLELGLYLVVQTAASDHYETISPFVVTVPIDNDGAWDYSVDAGPKVGAVTLTEEEEETPSVQTGTAETITGTTLPQTGQLYWPVPVLAGCGLLFFAVGWFLSHSGRKQAEHEG